MVDKGGSKVGWAAPASPPGQQVHAIPSAEQCATYESEQGGLRAYCSGGKGTAAERGMRRPAAGLATGAGICELWRGVGRSSRGIVEDAGNGGQV